VFKVPPVIDPFDAIKQRKDLSYLDLPPDLMRKYQQSKPQVKPVPEKRPQIDKKTLEAMNKPTAPPLPEPASPPKIENPAQPQPTPPTPKTESPVEAPHPSAVPARPNFAMGSQNPADQLREAMRGAAQNQGADSSAQPTGGLSRHPGAGAGGVQILSDMQGVDFNAWLHRWYYETEHTWDPLIPDEVNPPILKSGAVQIRFKVLPNGPRRPLWRHRSGPRCLGRAHWLQLPAAPARIPRTLSGAARSLPLQRAAAQVGTCPDGAIRRTSLDLSHRRTTVSPLWLSRR
jgi:hypothetical protein